MTGPGPSVIVLANCTHASLSLALRKSHLFSRVDSAELYSMARDAMSAFADKLADYDHILTIEHGANFGPLSTDELRARYGDKLVSLPTPFFSGLAPDMAYLRYDQDIARTVAVLGDYHSGLILEEIQAGFSKAEVVSRYVTGRSFERLDVEGVWADNISELKAREAKTDIALSTYIEGSAAAGTLAGQFLSFNHPTEGLINFIARDFILKATGIQHDGPLISRAEHNLYADAFWPLHPVVAARLGLPNPGKPVYKQPNRLGGAFMQIDEFAARSVDFIVQGHDLQKFAIVTPTFLPRRIGAARPSESNTMIEKPKPKKIVMTHFGRSGSTVIAELLKQHSKIAWLDEYFSLKWIRSRETYDFTLQQLLDMVDVEESRVHAKTPDVWVGHEIKLMNFLQNPSCNMIDYARATANPADYVHIVLRRRNILKRICSSYKAAQTQVYHVRDDDTAYRKKTFQINFGNLRDYDTGESATTFPELISKVQAREEAVLANYRKLGIQYLELYYEDDIEADPLKAYTRIVSHLGLEFEPAEVSLKKTGAALRNELENYDRLEEQMKASEHAWMLD